MIQCPWCGEQVILVGDVCPECKHEVLPEHLEGFPGPVSGDPVDPPRVGDYFDLEEVLKRRFKCSKCGNQEAAVKEVAMTGTGLSKLMDIQHNHYLFVSCLNCGHVEIYDPDVLRGQPSGKFSTILDLLFGG
ncbi:zinc ribbon domain-containing protein [Paenibacillus phoenicis]|uniref:Zinc ribbon domain-containing protein n=3 Tax=Paenibacillus TaxID=44249 RepID=A0ABU5PGV5_9BACL|nr:MULTISPECIES: zinc ribbon domain-containing protein [Paenibacillus]MEA3569175.1 zinc ribbon domain-containing protein [Paenibacillus phoenicis]